MTTVQFEKEELRALASKLRGWLVSGPEREALDSAENKIVDALKTTKQPGKYGQSITGHP